MSEANSIWKEVAARLSLVECAAKLGIELRVGLQASPFRDDKKKSFSVFRGKDGRLAFKDHADDSIKGSLWQFTALARPGWGKKEIAAFLFDASGVDPQPSEFSKGKSAEKRREVRDAAFMEARMDLHKVPEVPCPEPWSAEVSKRWNDGFQWLEKNAKRVADRRGWPESVVCDLIDAELMSGPLLPWSREKALGHGPETLGVGTQKSKAKSPRSTHGVAFKVQCPRRVGGKAGVLELVDVGYHQRFITFNHGERGKSWTFVPYVPDTERGFSLSDFQEVLVSQSLTVPPLPFVLGSLEAPRLVVIMEGQWDAITFFHACGWRCDQPTASAAVFGLRGVNGVDVFLAFYADWLRRVKPQVWLIGDNDSAGKKWAQKQNTEKILETPSFVDRLAALGCERVVYRTVAPKYGKDFNDFYKSAKPDPGFMARWMSKLGIKI